MTAYRLIVVPALALLLAAACGAAEEDDYWDPMEVEHVCGGYALIVDACSTDGPPLSELTDSCVESVRVDNVPDTAACYDAQLARYSCLGRLSCQELGEYVDASEGAKCLAEDEVVAAECSG